MKKWSISFLLAAVAGLLLCPPLEVQAQELQYRGVPEQFFADGFQVNIPEQCAGISAPVGAILDTSRSALFEFFGVNWGGFATRSDDFFPNQYVSLQFTPSVARGEVSWTVGPGHTGSFRVRISECPNDFRTQDEAPEDITWCTWNPVPSAAGSISTTEPGSGWQCPLVVGQSYYLNILLESCPASQCNFHGSLLPN